MTTRTTRTTTTKRTTDEDKEYDGLQWTTQQSNRKNVGRLQTRMDDKAKKDDGQQGG